MTEEEEKLAEEAAAAEAEAQAKADEEAKAAEALLQEQEIDYKTLAEAEKVRADAAEALIIKNKNIAKRQEGKEGEILLTEERVLELGAVAGMTQCPVFLVCCKCDDPTHHPKIGDFGPCKEW